MQHWNGNLRRATASLNMTLCKLLGSDSELFLPGQALYPGKEPTGVQDKGSELPAWSKHKEAYPERVGAQVMKSTGDSQKQLAKKAILKTAPSCGE